MEKLPKVTTTSIVYTYEANFNTDLQTLLHSCGVHKTSQCSVINSLKCSKLRGFSENKFSFNKPHLLKSHGVNPIELKLIINVEKCLVSIMVYFRFNTLYSFNVAAFRITSLKRVYSIYHSFLCFCYYE